MAPASRLGGDISSQQDTAFETQASTKSSALVFPADLCGESSLLLLMTFWGLRTSVFWQPTFRRLYHFLGIQAP